MFNPESTIPCSGWHFCFLPSRTPVQIFTKKSGIQTEDAVVLLLWEAFCIVKQDKLNIYCLLSAQRMSYLRSKKSECHLSASELASHLDKMSLGMASCQEIMEIYS